MHFWRFQFTHFRLFLKKACDNFASCVPTFPEPLLLYCDDHSPPPATAVAKNLVKSTGGGSLWVCRNRVGV